MRDTGLGISRKDQAHLFAPFSQAESTSARRFGGTGLGLAISSSLVEIMGGEIGLESTRRVGSTFWFCLPLWPAPAAGEAVPRVSPSAASEAPEPAAGQRGKYRIMVVDDDTINRLVAESQLEDLGFEVTAVESGKRALAAVERQSFDAILMDCQMPELDGYETTRRIRRHESPGRRAVIVAVTAHAMKGERERCLAAGMDDYLSKPLRGEDLRAVLDRWLLGGDASAEAGADRPSREPADRGPGRPASVGAAALDPGPLAAARELGRKTGRDIAGEMIEIFEREGPQRLEAMRRAFAGRDHRALAKAAHALGGSAAYLGAASLARLSRELEEMAQLEDLGGCETGLEALAEEHRRVLQELGGQNPE